MGVVDWRNGCGRMQWLSCTANLQEVMVDEWLKVPEGDLLAKLALDSDQRYGGRRGCTLETLTTAFESGSRYIDASSLDLLRPED